MCQESTSLLYLAVLIFLRVCGPGGIDSMHIYDVSHKAPWKPFAVFLCR